VVSGDAEVCGKARVGDNAQVFGKAEVCGNAKVYDDAKISGNAQVCDNARVYGKAVVCGNVLVYDNAEVYGNIFAEARARHVNGKTMSDLQVALETARHDLSVINGKRRCDIEQCERETWREDTSDTIKLLDAAIESFCRPAATERQI
jgi:carbonic anhydrase/acetyltransferase-like protein (isoleucine patch superfamily)